MSTVYMVMRYGRKTILNYPLLVSHYNNEFHQVVKTKSRTELLRQK